MNFARQHWVWTERKAYVVGAVGVALALILQLKVVPELQRQAIEARAAGDAQQRAAKERAARMAELRSAAKPADPTVDLPAGSEINVRVAGLAKVIGQRQLQGEAIDIATSDEPGLGLSLSRLTQTAKGRYADVREALRVALDSDPALALEDLRVSRNSAQQPDVQVQWTWVLLSRQPAPPVKP